MRDFKGMKRQRGRNNRGGSGGKPQQHNANRAFDSNGPEGVKVRGAAQSVYEFEDMVADAHMAARGNFVEWETADGETFKGLSPMPRFEQTPGRIWRPMPAKGGDTADVLSKLGYTEEQMAALEEEGAIRRGEN